MIFKVIRQKTKNIWVRIKGLKTWQKYLMLIGSYALIALMISSIFLGYINNVFLAVVQVDKKTSNFYNGQELDLTGIPKDATCLSFSHDNAYYTYLLDGSLYIKDSTTNKLVKKITESIPITYAITMNDRNIVIYFYNKVAGAVTATSSRSSSSSKPSSSKISSSSEADSSSSRDNSSSDSMDSSDSSSNTSSSNSSSADSSSDTSSVHNSSGTYSTQTYQIVASSSSAPSSSSASNDSSSKEASSSSTDSNSTDSSSKESSSNNSSSSTASNTSHESSSSQSSSKSSSSKSSSSTTYSVPVNSEKIIFRTYNIDNENNTDEQTFYANSGSTIKQVVYSSLTNIIYVNTQSGTGTALVNNVYKINIMSNIWLYSSNKVIENMVSLNNEDDIYLQDKNGAVYYNNSRIYLFNEAVKLIGRDGDDKVYFESKTKKGTIYVVSGKKIVNTITLQDTNYSHFYYTYSNIYAVYIDCIIDITKDTMKKISYDNQNTFTDIVGERIYLQNPTGLFLSLLYA